METQMDAQDKIKSNFERVVNSLTLNPEKGSSILVSTTRITEALACQTVEGEWTINCIMYDDFEPGILNHNEVAEIMLKLDYPIFANGFLEISISSDNGNSVTKTTKAT